MALSTQSLKWKYVNCDHRLGDLTDLWWQSQCFWQTQKSLDPLLTGWWPASSLPSGLRTFLPKISGLVTGWVTLWAPRSMMFLLCNLPCSTKRETIYFQEEQKPVSEQESLKKRLHKGSKIINECQSETKIRCKALDKEAFTRKVTRKHLARHLMSWRLLDWPGAPQCEKSQPQHLLTL